MDLQRQLQSLACAKFKILKKHPPGREVDPGDSFSFNHDFSSPLQKIKISTVASKVESNEETKKTRDRVDEERRHQTEAGVSLGIVATCFLIHFLTRQACIVRVMKDRKHMTHNDLINEVTKQLASRFQPNPLHIKKQIESLIEVIDLLAKSVRSLRHTVYQREFLERCPDRKSYNYLVNKIFL